MSPDDPKQWLYLFTSSIRELYAIDALNTLAVPDGWILHYRYHKRYVHNILQDKLSHRYSTTSELSTSFEGLDVVVSFTYQSVTNNKSYTVLGLYPLRVGKVVQAFIEGEVAHFFISMGQLFDYTTDSSLRDHQEALNQVLSNQTPYNNIHAGVGKGYPLAAVTPETNVKAFQSIVKVLSGQGFRDDSTVFVTFHGLRGINHNAKKVAPTQPMITVDAGVLHNQSGYTVTPGQTYVFDVSSYHKAFLNRPYLSNTALEIIADPAYFTLLGRTSIQVRGRYDTFGFPLSVIKQKDSSWTLITIRATPGTTIADVDNDGKEIVAAFRGTEWTIPVYIQVNPWRKYTVRTMLVVSEIGIAVGTALLASLALQEANIMSTTGTIAIVLAVGGVAIRAVLFGRE